MSHLLDEIVRAQKRGEPRGIPSICSAHPAVLESALRQDHPVLIESTCNQVNQFGGYTGMTPEAFRDFVLRKAGEAGFPAEQLILGGDHLGPSPWQDLPAEEAMANAETLVRSYASAGFTKLHIDASMKLGGDDPARPLGLAVSSCRAARLILAAEEAAPDAGCIRYVVGTEVPLPGGALTREEGVEVTRPEAAGATLDAAREALEESGTGSARDRVIALVVQPGVEYGSDFVLPYSPEKASALARFSESTPVIFEAHSTDYQNAIALRSLVRDHFAILKVGPALTFAYREAMFELAGIEDEVIRVGNRSCLIDTLEVAMLRNPKHWRGHYHGTDEEIARQRKFSLSDRIRYYWNEPDVTRAVKRLRENLEGSPEALQRIVGLLPPGDPEAHTGGTVDAFIERRVSRVLADYATACAE